MTHSLSLSFRFPHFFIHTMLFFLRFCGLNSLLLLSLFKHRFFSSFPFIWRQNQRKNSRYQQNFFVVTSEPSSFLSFQVIGRCRQLWFNVEKAFLCAYTPQTLGLRGRYRHTFCSINRVVLSAEVLYSQYACGSKW